jgi:hypothetical protein
MRRILIRGRVLVVEADAIARNLMIRVLTGQGFKVYEAATAEEALDLGKSLADEQIDLLIADHATSERDVTETILASCANTKVLQISGGRLKNCKRRRRYCREARSSRSLSRRASSYIACRRCCVRAHSDGNRRGSRAVLCKVAWVLCLLILLAPLAAVAEDLNALEIVKRSVGVATENSKRARNYTFIQRTEERELGPNREIKSQRSKTYDVTMLEGSSYRRLIERNDRPLPADEEKREQDNLRKSIEDRRHETSAQRAARLAEYEKRPGRNREMLKEIPEAFDFRIRGEETVNARSAYVIEATPRAGYRPSNPEARMFLPKLKATLWIDKADLNWVRVDAEVIDDITWGWFLLRLSKGAHLYMEQVRVNDEVWLPHRVLMAGAARIGLIKKLKMEQDLTFRDYRRFQTDAHLRLPEPSR